MKVSSAFDTDMYSYTLVWARCRETPHSEEMYSNAPKMYSNHLGPTAAAHDLVPLLLVSSPIFMNIKKPNAAG